MKILRGILYLLLSLVLLFALFVLIASLSDYKPEEREVIFESSEPDTIMVHKPINILSWNLGYGGLGKDMDFFYDEGTQVRTSEENTHNNLEAISSFLFKNDTVDIFLLQEVDKRSKRTYLIDEVKQIANSLSYPNHSFAYNYKVFFVPLPFTEPMGKAHSGLMSLSKFKPFIVERYDFPGSYPWPKNLFMLDRCFLVERYTLSNQNELLVINTHNSAFDGGELKKHEMEYLKNFILKEYNSGNYVVVGGDWNQNPPGFDTSTFNDGSGYQNFELASISDNYLPSGWKWSYDDSFPTNRSLVSPYDPANSATTVLDFFLLSPNVQTKIIKTINLNFENSDHQPVLISIWFN